MDVTEVRPLGGHRLWLRFEDGSAGELDLDEHLQFAGEFESLRDPQRFARVSVNPDLGTIEWPGELDIDPDVLWSWLTGRSIPWASTKADS